MKTQQTEAGIATAMAMVLRMLRRKRKMMTTASKAAQQGRVLELVQLRQDLVGPVAGDVDVEQASVAVDDALEDGAHLAGHVDGVVGGDLVDLHLHGVAAVEALEGPALRVLVAHLAEVAQAQVAPGQGQVPDLGGLLELAADPGQVAAPGLVDAAEGDVEVAGPQLAGEEGQGDVVGLQALLVQLDDQLLLLEAVDLDVGDAVDAQDPRLHHVADDVEEAVLVPLPRQVGLEHGVGLVVPAEQGDAVHVGGQQPPRPGRRGRGPPSPPGPCRCRP